MGFVSAPALGFGCDTFRGPFWVSTEAKDALPAEQYQSLAFEN